MTGSCKSTKVPNLRFPEFTADWDEKPLDSMFPRIRNGFVGTATPYYEVGAIPYLQGKNIKSGAIDPTGLVEVSLGFHKKQSKSQLKVDDLLMVQSGHVGECAVVTREFADTNCHALIVMTPNDTVSSSFCSKYFYSPSGLRHIYKIKTGNTIRHILTSDLKPLRLNFPLITEQKKIATFLDAVDEKLIALRRKKELLTDYKCDAIQKIFSQQIRFTRDDGSAFPDWEKKRFGQMFERVTRKNTEDNKNVLTISAQQGLVNQESYFNKSVSAQDVTGYYLLHRGDFAYNKSYSKGYPMGAIKRLNRYDKGVVSTLYICFRLISGGSAVFFEQLFESGGLNRELHKIAQEGARNHGLLNVSVLEFFKDITVSAPHTDEQAKIADFLSSLDAKIDTVADQITQMETFKKGLLQQMFV